jgi:hypothetical protein
MHLVVRALAREAWDEAAKCIRQEPDDPWDAARFQAALEPFYQEYDRLLFDPRAKRAHHTQLLERDPLRWDVRQVLVDDRGDDIWHIDGAIDLSEEVALDAPLVAIRRIGT